MNKFTTRLKLIFCSVLLLVSCAGNTFAYSSLSYNSVYDFFGEIIAGAVNTVVAAGQTVESIINPDDDSDCPLRICGDCPPSNPSCRPK